MANSVRLSLVLSMAPHNSPGNRVSPDVITHKYASGKGNWITDATSSCKTAPFRALKLKATGNQPSTKPNSILCADCEGNGCKKCSQCQGTGVNSVDHFNGQFKAGSLCWLCRGEKEILCGNCNGAGLIGGSMSTQDD